MSLEIFAVLLLIGLLLSCYAATGARFVLGNLLGIVGIGATLPTFIVVLVLLWA